MYQYLQPQGQMFKSSVGETDANGCTICQSCASGYLTAFMVGGLVSAVVLLGIAPALRIHKEYRKQD